MSDPETRRRASKATVTTAGPRPVRLKLVVASDVLPLTTLPRSNRVLNAADGWKLCRVGAVVYAALKAEGSVWELPAAACLCVLHDDEAVGARKLLGMP